MNELSPIDLPSLSTYVIVDGPGIAPRAIALIVVRGTVVPIGADTPTGAAKAAQRYLNRLRGGPPRSVAEGVNPDLAG